jgi:hypothetical protein
MGNDKNTQINSLALVVLGTKAQSHEAQSHQVGGDPAVNSGMHSADQVFVLKRVVH